MLDFSFSELLVCFVVALVVLGPERMPGIARAAGRWTGKARSYVRNLTAELERESQIAEIKKQVVDAQRILREESDSFHKTVKGTVDSVKGTVDDLEARGRSSAVTEALPPAAEATTITPAIAPPTEAGSPAIAAEPTPAKPQSS